MHVRWCLLHRVCSRGNASVVIDACFFRHVYVVRCNLRPLLKDTEQLTLAYVTDSIAVRMIGVSETMDVLIEYGLVVLWNITVQLCT